MSAHDTELLHRAFYLTGPTASGKTRLGILLAEQLGAEIIALDSMSLYRGLDIGTAKPTPEERARVPHHLIDVLEPWESATVADYRRWAIAAARDIKARGRSALFVGGTPLYLKVLLRGLFEGPESDPALRADLEHEAEQFGDARLHERLRQVDPQAAARIQPGDRRRIVRALEIYLQTGRPISDWQREHDQPAVGVAVLALDRPRSDLHRRINQRVVDMFESGFIDEVRRLLEGKRPLHRVPAQAVGYREVAELLAGQATRDQTIERIRARTRQFAKRQMTWFRGLREVEFAPLDPHEDEHTVVARLRKRFDEYRKVPFTDRG